MMCKERKQSRIRTVQMNNLRGFLGIRRMNKYRMHYKRAVRSGERGGQTDW